VKRGGPTPNSVGISSGVKAIIDLLPEQREATIEFESFKHWMAWTRTNPHIFAAEFSNQIAGRIRANGFVEPITGTHVRPNEIEGPIDQLREGLVYNGLNARARAVMRMIETQINMESWASLKIYAPEAITALALRLRGFFSLLPRFGIFVKSARKERNVSGSF